MDTRYPSHPEGPAATLSQVLTTMRLDDPLEAAVGFGRLWIDGVRGQLLLSAGAARFLDVGPGLHDSIEGFASVVAEDLPKLLHALAQSAESEDVSQCEFRVIHATGGLRWLQWRSVVSTSGLASGVLADVTASKIAAMRERFSYELTRFLVGTQDLDHAVTRVLQLVCENLGWEWGAYWSFNPAHDGGPALACGHHWNFSDPGLIEFTMQSCAVNFGPGQGLIGQVWSSGQAVWVDAEDAALNITFLRTDSMRDGGLKAGYIFPVSYVAEDGREHRAGVLEFFSRVPRQREAQLPDLAHGIGQLVAQTAQRTEQQEVIRRLAQTDDLTGLANRAHFHQLLAAACVEATASGQTFSLLYIDLDRFKPINDAFGHEAGNLVLCEFAQRLQHLVAAGGHVGRLGGDEFAMLTPLGAPLTGPQTAQDLAARVEMMAGMPFQFEGNELTVAASLGISVFADHGCTVQELLRSADAAMYRCKRNGQRFSFENSPGAARLTLRSTMLARELNMETELQHAAAENQFFLEYQPVFDNFSRRLVAVEALLRWRRANGELVPPDIFIPIAEKSRLIGDISRWVTRRACQELSLLHAAGLPGLTVAVNMAPGDFHAGLPRELLTVVESYGIDTRNLCLELTEGAVMQNAEKVIPVMARLRELGFGISLDDFGMGHSSLSRLKTLPISAIKIDRSFVSGLPQDRGDGAIVRTMLDLGRHMKLAVVAEGVETDAQLLYLSQFGCPLIQGYLLSRPMPLGALIAAYAVPVNDASIISVGSMDEDQCGHDTRKAQEKKSDDAGPKNGTGATSAARACLPHLTMTVQPG